MKGENNFNKLVKISLWFLILYFIVLIITLSFATEIDKSIIYDLPIIGDNNLTTLDKDIIVPSFIYNSLQLLFSSFVAISLGIISIGYSNVLTNFHAKLKYFGISDVRTNRKGQDPKLTSIWMDRIKGTKELIIVGTTARGWFVYAKNELDNMIETSSSETQIKIFLLNPFGLVWKSKLDGFQYGYNMDNFIKQYLDVLETLIAFKKKYDKKVQIWFYDIEPISCVITDKYIYYALYLPLESRPDVPELQLDIKSDLAQKLYKDITENLIDEKRKSFILDLNNLLYYNSIMKHIDNLKKVSQKKEMIFSQIITCDFCKEKNGLPTRYHKLYENEINFRERIIHRYDNFYLLPTLGQITPNYLLITSNHHITGSSQLNICGFNELTNIKNDIISINKNIKNGKTLFFEHGIPYEGIQCFGGCGISHLHIHAVPMPNMDIAKFFSELDKFLSNKINNYEIVSFKEWKDIEKYKHFSYILVEFDKVVKVLLFNSNALIGEKDDVNKIPSQLLRLFVSKILKIRKNHDWKTYKNEYQEIIKCKNFYQEKLNI